MPNDIIRVILVCTGTVSLLQRKHIYSKARLREEEVGRCWLDQQEAPSPPPSTSTRGVAPRDGRRIEHKSGTTGPFYSSKQRLDIVHMTAPKQPTMKNV